MKKTVLLFATFFLAIGAFAQETKTVGSFQKLSVFDKIEVTLIPSKENKMEVSGSNIDNVNFINKNGYLKIKMNTAYSFQGENTKVKLYYVALNEIVADEGAKINSNSPVKATSLLVNGKAGGKVNLEVKVDDLTVRAATGGEVTLIGKATKQDVLSNAGAVVHNDKLITKDTNVTVNAGGKANVNATELVDAKTRAGGEINVYGDPKKVNEKVVMGGSINFIK